MGGSQADSQQSRSADKPVRADGVPNSAWFAAFEAARSYGDAFLAFEGAAPSAAEIEIATARYQDALQIFPFEPQLYSSLRSALERQGRVNDFLTVVRPIAHHVTDSPRVTAFIESNQEGAKRVAILRRALSDELALMYLGFADGSGLNDLSKSLTDLQARKQQLERERSGLEQRRQQLVAGKSQGSPPASPAEDASPRASGGTEPMDLDLVEHRLAEANTALERVMRQIEARSSALPLYRAALDNSDLSRELASRRDHPAHQLIRELAFDRIAPSANGGRN
jgi:hypothetical protein